MTNRLSKRRRVIATTVLASTFLILAAAMGALAGSIVTTAGDRSAAVPGGLQLSTGGPVIKRAPAAYATVSEVPVLVYHEMNNGCGASSPTCINRSDQETVSTAQFTSQMAYLLDQGYHAITMAQYIKWLSDRRGTMLPSRPILLTADNGIWNFLQGATPVLHRDGFTMTAMVVTGFANAATTRHCVPRGIRMGARLVSSQPGCPAGNIGWDATWPQLRSLPSGNWNFALEAGDSGHYVQDYASRCKVFMACTEPGESRAHYEQRVQDELSRGEKTLSTALGSRVSGSAWTVPYSDLGYKRCAQSDCTPQPYNGPAGWLSKFAARHFTAVFVEDAFRNGTGHERFRYDINGSDTQRQFRASLEAFTSAGDFNH